MQGRQHSIPSMSEEKELVKKRGSFKGQLTTFIKYLDSLDDKKLSSCDVTELQLRVGKIESLYEQYNEVQLRLECIVDDTKSQYSERSDFESLYYKSLSKAQNILGDYNTDNQSITSEKTIRFSKSKPVKLPTIELPKFSGSFINWLEFRDTFISLIHTNDEIDNINKFHYLRRSLEGSAAVVIQSVQFSASNYPIAWNVLCERFDSKNILIKNHVSALFNIDTITKESSTALKVFVDQLNKNLRALESLGEPVQHWDTLLIHIFTRKLDRVTYREWEEYKSSLDKDSIISFQMFIKFVRNRADFIESLEMSRNDTNQAVYKSGHKLKSMVTTQSSNNYNTAKVCPKCKDNHYLNICPQFLAMSNEERLKLVPSYKVCYNCLRKGHFANNCKKPGCNVCKRKHNTLIHSQVQNASNIRSEHSYRCTDNAHESSCLPIASDDSEKLTLSANVSPSCNIIKQRTVLLSTALIKLFDNNNCEHVVRAVLDSGSTSCFVTERLCRKLNINTYQVNGSLFGINNVSSHVGKSCHVKMTPLNNSYVYKLYCLVLPLITSVVPCQKIDISGFNIPSNICLADPTFYEPSEVDVLIGADLFWDLLGSQQLQLGTGMPVLCESKLGWIVSGPVTFSCVKYQSNDIKCNLTQITSTDGELYKIRNDLTRFWRLEELNTPSSHYMPEERMCEEHFVQNTTRLSDGRFCVRIPLKRSTSLLGDSFKRATQCLYTLERRLKHNADFSKLYYNFMSEYIMLNHMTEIKELKSDNYFIPHHGVLRECSLTTKLRVVFNASCPTSSGTSFNDIQMVGPTIQDDLLAILLRFRMYKYILSADVEKMYRQIVVHSSDRHLQQIVWRNNPSDSIKIYQLNTVTYGTASAPFLATRCIKQIGLECKNEKISDIIKHDFYVDDLLTGGNNLDEVKFIRTEVTKALASACMPLRKWRSNEPHLVSEDYHSSLDLNMGSSEPNKLLGLNWFSKLDNIGFFVSSVSCKGSTKRDLLSAIARIFDPLGLLSPVIITMKILLQRMWLDKLSWDEPLNPELNSVWSSIVKALPLLNNIRIPRIVVCDSYKTFELHVFTDASERAYGACVYVRTINEYGECMVRLLMAKSRVAPIKPVTIPRLELCGALVGARICKKVLNSIRLKVNHIYCWTDSTIVLGWLQMLPAKLQPFVRNRVAEILDEASNCTWRHVPTDQNPADLISRGVDISVLQDLDLWWSGPTFLVNDQSSWPSQLKHLEIDLLPEIRPNVTLNVVVKESAMHDTFIDFNRFSNYLRLVRSVAYVLRFVNLCRKHNVFSKVLTQTELQNSLDLLIIKSQSESFSEYKLLLNKEDLPKKSPLLKFSVYLDDKRIMRVGGRLNNSNFCYNKKHPVILQSTHRFTKLLFEFEHKKLMHAGPQLLLASIRESYWPIGGRNLAKACYRKCIRCQRMMGKVVNPLMGHLPQRRLQPGHPFESTGVDYAGPIMCANRQGRGCRLIKVYIAIFICFTTKAIHLELVGDLTSNSYLLALNRFISRRGKPIHIYSDNGTSFVGAYNDISKFLKSHSESLSDNLANEGINFHFIPAYTPHFGGLWEAGVKSTKYHLQRVLGHCNLTFEELYTTLTQIEAILNSRPLTPLSSDPADYTPLTPGHFLIGRPLTALPQPAYKDEPCSRLTRFQRIEQLRQHFWSRWSKEYVSELQQKTKWRSSQDNLKLDTLVVVKEENLPPLKWRLGRVIAVYPGSDGIVRVADIQTSTGVIRRAFNKICPLPVD